MKPIPSLEDDIAQSMEQAMILNSFIKRLSATGPATLWLEGVADEVLAMPSARAGREPSQSPLSRPSGRPSTIAKGEGQ